MGFDSEQYKLIIWLCFKLHACLEKESNEETGISLVPRFWTYILIQTFREPVVRKWDLEFKASYENRFSSSLRAHSYQVGK